MLDVQCSMFFKAEAVGLEPTTDVCPHLFSKQAPDPAGWLPMRLIDARSSLAFEQKLKQSDIAAAAVAGFEPAIVSLTGSCLTIWPHRIKRNVRIDSRLKSTCDRQQIRLERSFS